MKEYGIVVKDMVWGGEGSPIFEVFESFGKFGVVFEGGGETCRPPGSGVVRGGLKWG